MKQIVAVIQPFKLTKVRNALRHIKNFPGMTVTRSEGFGQEITHSDHKNIRAELTDFSPKVRIIIISPVEMVDEIVAVIRETADTGQTGAGLIWVSPVDQIYKLGRHHD